MNEKDGDSGKLMSELPPLTIGDQDDREYWNQPRVLATTGGNLKAAKSGILDWLKQSCIKHKVPNNAKVLVIGGGPGRLVKGMQQLIPELTNNWEITVAEGSKGMVEIAKKNLENLYPEAEERKILQQPLCKVNYLHLNAMDLEYEEEFDLVWTCTVFQHNSRKNKEIFMPKIYKALKPGGLIICLEGVKTEKHWVLPNDEFPEGRFKRYGEQGRFTFDWHDKKGAKGTGAWWINDIGQYGFEIIEFGSHYQDWFVFRKIKEVGKDGAENN